MSFGGSTDGHPPRRNLRILGRGLGDKEIQLSVEAISVTGGTVRVCHTSSYQQDILVHVYYNK